MEVKGPEKPSWHVHGRISAGTNRCLSTTLMNLWRGNSQVLDLKWYERLQYEFSKVRIVSCSTRIFPVQSQPHNNRKTVQESRKKSRPIYEKPPQNHASNSVLNQLNSSVCHSSYAYQVLASATSTPTALCILCTTLLSTNIMNVCPLHISSSSSILHAAQAPNAM